MSKDRPTCPPAVTFPAWQVALLLYGSGLCALSYQTVWLREFRLIFGASTAASAAVLAIFMGGLGLGGLLLGHRADAQARPLRFYACLELLIATSAAVTPALVWVVRQAYLLTGGSPALGMTVASGIRLVLAALVLGVPTLAMGGTLPAAARAAVTSADADRRKLALLYAANTLGAVCGALVTTFVLLEKYGNRRTLWLACAFNGLVALTALGLARKDSVGAVAPNPTKEPLPASRSRQARGDESRTGPGAVSPRFVLSAAGVSGFAFFLMELVWYRMLSPLLGGSVFTFGLILAVALLGVGLGGVVYTLRRPQRIISLHGLALTFALEALCLAIPFACGDRVAFLALSLRPLAAAGFYANALGWAMVAGVVILPAAVIAGFQFPLLLALLGRGGERVGRQVGLAYAWNTVGAIAGSLAGGFGLLPILSAPGVWRATVALLALVSAGAGILACLRGASTATPGQRPARLRSLAGLSVAVLSCLLLIANGPTAAWRYSSIGVGRADQFSRGPANQLRDQVQLWRRTLVWEADGTESSVALTADKALSFLVNGKNDGNARTDAGTTVMMGLIGAMLHPHPAKAFVVGLGSGSTAGWIGAVPSIELVDVVELEPAVIRVAQACEPVNHGVLRDARVHIVIGDAREVLALARNRYDLIVSEPSNPYRAGIASLFTREFYEAASRKLTENGLFLQWVQAYEVDLATVQTACATLAAVFPVVETWQTLAGDLLFVGALRPIQYDVSRLRQRLEEEPFKSAVPRIWRVTDLEGFLAHFLSSNALAEEIARTPGVLRNTDDRTIMEFSFARSVGQHELFDTRHWLALSKTRHTDRPATCNGEVDWIGVEDGRASMFAVEGLEPPVPADLSADQVQRAQAKVKFVNHDLSAALAAWRAQPNGPADLTELLLLGESLAEAGNEEALRHIAKLRLVEPAEADVVTARLRWRQHRFAEATEALEAAFVRYRSDPWPLPLLMYRALDMAQALTKETQDRALAKRLHAALGEPFAVRLWDQIRLACRFNIALDSADTALLKEAVEAFEPHVPWRRYFLEKRLGCYAVLGDPRAPQAKADLQAFLRSAGSPAKSSTAP